MVENGQVLPIPASCAGDRLSPAVRYPDPADLRSFVLLSPFARRCLAGRYFRPADDSAIDLHSGNVVGQVDIVVSIVEVEG